MGVIYLSPAAIWSWTSHLVATIPDYGGRHEHQHDRTAHAQTVSNCNADRFRLDERLERWSISTPTTSFDSL